MCHTKIIFLVAFGGVRYIPNSAKFLNCIYAEGIFVFVLKVVFCFFFVFVFVLKWFEECFMLKKVFRFMLTIR
jgi:hypothetical protein